MRNAIAMLALAASLSACSGPTSGVCCPLENPCGVGGNGGWAPSEDMCEAGQGFDGQFTLETDEQGCQRWVAAGFCPGGEMCCTEP